MECKRIVNECIEKRVNQSNWAGRATKMTQFKAISYGIFNIMADRG